jgi:hypothetical protein
MLQLLQLLLGWLLRRCSPHGRLTAASLSL